MGSFAVILHLLNSVFATKHNIRSEKLSCVPVVQTDPEGSTLTSKLTNSWALLTAGIWALLTAETGPYRILPREFGGVHYVKKNSVSQVSKPVHCVSGKCLPRASWHRAGFSPHAGLRLGMHCHRESFHECHQGTGGYLHSQRTQSYPSK